MWNEWAVVTHPRRWQGSRARRVTIYLGGGNTGTSPQRGPSHSNRRRADRAETTRRRDGRRAPPIPRTDHGPVPRIALHRRPEHRARLERERRKVHAQLLQHDAVPATHPPKQNKQTKQNETTRPHPRTKKSQPPTRGGRGTPPLAPRPRRTGGQQSEPQRQHQPPQTQQDNRQANQRRGRRTKRKNARVEPKPVERVLRAERAKREPQRAQPRVDDVPPLERLDELGARSVPRSVMGVGGDSSASLG